MENFEIGQQVERILHDYRNHILNDFEMAIEDIAQCYSHVQGDEAKQKFFTEFLWPKFGDEYVKVPRGGNDPRPAIDLIIRSWARFGPADHLPAYLFSILGFEKGPHDFWEREILPAFRDALQKDGDRFKDEVIKAIEQTMRTTGLEPDGSPRPAFQDLARVAGQILYKRFRKTLAEPGKQAGAEQPKVRNPRVINEAKTASKDELAELMRALNVDWKLAAALRKCREYLESSDPFQAKAAGDLLRSAIDSVNRSVVKELEKITGISYQAKDKDELRRQYFVKVNFINEHEKKFFTSVYGLISNESNHQLDAPKETVLVMERTVTDYLILLLRRLLERKGGNLPTIEAAHGDVRVHTNERKSNSNLHVRDCGITDSPSLNNREGSNADPGGRG